MDLRPSPENFDNWVPVRVYWQDNHPYIDWCYIHARRFVDSFFDNTIQKSQRNPFSVLFRHQTPADHLQELNAVRPGLLPAGFIFHMSRCGSTLVSQMLASLSQNIVISEASPIDAILRTNLTDPAIKDEQRMIWLRGIIGALGKKRFAEEANYFIKLDSWNTLDLELVRRAFPTVPWIFLYRDPLEVIVSQMRQRGAQMVPGSLKHILPGLDFMESFQLPAEEYCARVLEKFCENVLREINRDGSKALLINYNQLPEAVFSIISDHFGMSYSTEDAAKMNSVTKFDAKSSTMEFAPDGKAKRDEASDAAKNASLRVVPLYEKLESLRKS